MKPIANGGKRGSNTTQKHLSVTAFTGVAQLVEFDALSHASKGH